MNDLNMHIKHDSEGRAALIVHMSYTKECASCGMDDSMEHDLELCPVCHCCLIWEDEFGRGSCCTCPKTVRSMDDIYARNPNDD